MKKLSLILLACFLVACSSKRQHVDYVLSWKGDGIGVSVNLVSPKDTVLFTYASENGGITDQLSWLQDFNVSVGQVLIDSASRQLTIIPNHGCACFSYTVRCTLPNDYGSPGGCLMDMFRPDIDENMLFARTENIFVSPLDESDYNMPVSVVWESVPDYPVFCLYNAGKGTERFDGRMSDIAWTVMVGDPLLSVDTVLINGHINYLVTALRKRPEENKAELKAYFKSFYAAIADFWEEDYTEPYSTLFFPFRSNTFEVTGNGFSNGFVSRYDATADTVLTKSRRDVFTHEIGHKWLYNGPMWFPEGFNEMQTAYQLVASGLETPDYFATYFNASLEGLYHNPYRNVKDEVAEEKFWADNDYIWLLYRRGFCYAFHLTGIYEKETGQTNAWKAIMKAVKPFIDDFSEDKFLEAMASLMSRERLESDYRNYILEGKDFEFHPEDLPSGCDMKRNAEGIPQLIITDSFLFSRHFQ